MSGTARQWAHIVNASVYELTSTDPSGRFYPTLTWVECTGIAGIAPGWLYNGSTFTAPATTPPTPPQLAAALLAGGLAVTSTGTPALDATYATSPAAQAAIGAIMTGINAGKGFPDGLTSLPYPDASGAAHSFSVAQFTAFAQAIENFVYGCSIVINGFSTTLPAANATIP